MVFFNGICFCLMPIEISTSMSRSFLSPSCDLNSICFDYLNVAQDTQREMIVKFHTRSVPVESFVEFSEENSKLSTKVNCFILDMNNRIIDEPRYVHTCDLINLKPNQVYKYLIQFKTDKGVSVKKLKKFRTSRDNPLIISGGDKSLNSVALQLIQLTAKQSPDFFIIGGDIAYTNGRASCYRRWDDFFREWERNAITPEGYTIPLLTTIGNHESLDGFMNNERETASEYLSYFSHKIASNGINRPLYHFHLIGNHSSITVLDSGIITDHQSQSQWLEKIWNEDPLSKRSKITLYHVPLYPSVRDFNFKESALGRKYWLPLFDKHKVSLSLENHDHMFKRTFHMKNNHKSTDGTVYIGDGCFGTLKHKIPAEKPWYAFKFGKHYHLWILNVESTGITAKAVNENGVIVDSFKINSK
jgi:acid phosphatase type 7